MDKLKKSRTPLRTQLTKLTGELQQLLTEENLDRTKIRVKFTLVTDTYSKIEEVDLRIIEAILETDCSEEDLNREYESITEYKEKFETCKVSVEDSISLHKSPSTVRSQSSERSGNTARTTNQKKTYKLPKIEIKRFNGELNEWLGFWAQFQKIHEDAELHSSDKFQYLVQAMEPDTRARQLVDSYPQTAENYPKVVSALTDRFGDKVLLAEMYVRQLLKLVSCTGGNNLKALTSLYDQLECNLHALESLGVTTDHSAIFLYPLIESSLPEELIKVWQRSVLSGYSDEINEKPVEQRLKSLMQFLRKEVKGAERLSIVHAGRDDNSKLKSKKTQAKPSSSRLLHDEPPTAAGLFSAQTLTCIFCEKSHESRECVKAQDMDLTQKREKVQSAKCCFRCLKTGHLAKRCRAVVKCMICGRKHITLMCSSPPSQRGIEDAKWSNSEEKITEVPRTNNQLNCTSDFLLQTLVVELRNGNKRKRVRALCDSGSQRSYLLKETADQLGLKPVCETQLCHMLFGGSCEYRHHNVYNAEVHNVDGRSSIKMQVLDQNKICGHVARMDRGPWLTELKEKKIFVNDLGSHYPKIECLIGADYYAQLLTGKQSVLKNGLVALETHLGWTLSGRCNSGKEEKIDDTVGMSVISMHVQDLQVKNLWELEIIGIRDPVEVVSREARDMEMKLKFLDTIVRQENGRYSVQLPWTECHPTLPHYKNVAEKRLLATSRKLQSSGNFEKYNDVLQSWLEEDIIEMVDLGSEAVGHYLPHRAVLRPDSHTTPLRPVFDASCKTHQTPSINDCLEKGPNLLEVIPNVLLRFRMKTIGVTADIRKAFQMIEVAEYDRDFLRFLWWEDYDRNVMKVFRHKRVVFGLNCSPFILEAVIEFHLKQVPDRDQETAKKLLRSFYVDNCVTSVDTMEDYEKFREASQRIMAEAKMDLCQWECSLDGLARPEVIEVGNGENLNQPLTQITSVLGLKWNKERDCLSCDIPDLATTDIITKRTVLSAISKVYDPIGFTCPALLPMKLLLQKSWLAKLNWDQELPEDGKRSFNEWLREISFLLKLEVPRNVTGSGSHQQQVHLHTFSDASQDAYAAVIYLRTQRPEGVTVQLLLAKSRVAPIKRPSIPRLELLGCVIAARLIKQVKVALDDPNIETFHWTDSSTALAWIHRNNDWGTFIGNRVKEICRLTNPEDWRHIPGIVNPADLPSRGCSPSKLLLSKWWEGPSWLKEPKEKWPRAEEKVNEAEVEHERKRSVSIKSMTVVVKELWYATRFSSFHRNVRVVAWMRRFIAKTTKLSNESGSLTCHEILEAEKAIFRLVQEEAIPKDTEKISQLNVSKDKEGLLRVHTKLFHESHEDYFRSPILLPSKHLLVDQLILHEHLKSGHAGVQYLMSKLREHVWILQARRSIGRVLGQCKNCLRFTGKAYTSDPAALPENRVNMVAAFQVTGVDLAGPLFLKKGGKAWIVLFTCAVYRCVHLDFVTSLSTEAFLEALQRFINLRGRPSTLYSDNGTNFTGTAQAFKKLDWNVIQSTSNVMRINWIFNPPSASWWGGWWERLIRTAKDLIKRMLGRSRVNAEALRTCLSEVEAVMNDRPLTTVSQDSEDLIPLTPAMFMRGIATSEFPEYQEVNSSQLQHSFQKKRTILQELRGRFRNEYLAQLVQRAAEKACPPSVGDVVLVEQGNKKRLEWPLARIEELIPGRDGKIRVVRVRTAHGILTRPVQKLYPLEVSRPEALTMIERGKGTAEEVTKRDADRRDKHFEVGNIQTRSGRTVRHPDRYTDASS